MHLVCNLTNLQPITGSYFNKRFICLILGVPIFEVQTILAEIFVEILPYILKDGRCFGS